MDGMKYKPGVGVLLCAFQSVQRQQSGNSEGFRTLPILKGTSENKSNVFWNEFLVCIKVIGHVSVEEDGGVGGSA